jgi:hypothetical protein
MQADRIMLHKLSALYAQRPETEYDTETEPDPSQWIQRLGEKPFTEMDDRSRALLLVDAARLARRKGLEAPRPLVEAVEEPLPRLALEMVVDRTEPERIMEVLEARVGDFGTIHDTHLFLLHPTSPSRFERRRTRIPCRHA